MTRNNGSHRQLTENVNCRDRPTRLAVPMADPDERTYIATQNGHIDCHLSPAGTVNLRRLHAGLVADGASLASGRPVVSKADSIRWLLENVESDESDESGL